MVHKKFLFFQVSSMPSNLFYTQIAHFSKHSLIATFFVKKRVDYT